MRETTWLIRGEKKGSKISCHSLRSRFLSVLDTAAVRPVLLEDEENTKGTNGSDVSSPFLLTQGLIT